MKRKVLSVVAIIWGGLIVARYLIVGPSTTQSGAYVAGQTLAAFLGIVMLGAGLHQWIKASHPDDEAIEIE